MVPQEVDVIRLKEAVKKFGSLQKAINSLQTQKKSLEANVSVLIKDVDAKEKARTKYLDDINHLEETVEERKLNIANLEEAFKKSRQDFEAYIESIRQFLLEYQMCKSFVAMLKTSPTNKESIRELASNIIMIGEATWSFSNNPDKLRWLFVQLVLGNHLHCYRCDRCGIKFIANKKAQSGISGYQCPKCGIISTAKPDDSFIEAMLGSSKPANTNQRQQP